MERYPHDVYETTDGKVGLSNQNDDFYWCHFESREEVNEFIQKLEKVRDKIFGKKK